MKALFLAVHDFFIPVSAVKLLMIILDYVLIVYERWVLIAIKKLDSQAMKELLVITDFIIVEQFEELSIDGICNMLLIHHCRLTI